MLLLPDLLLSDQSGPGLHPVHGGRWGWFYDCMLFQVGNARDGHCSEASNCEPVPTPLAICLNPVTDAENLKSRAVELFSSQPVSEVGIYCFRCCLQLWTSHCRSRWETYLILFPDCLS